LAFLFSRIEENKKGYPLGYRLLFSG